MIGEQMFYKVLCYLIHLIFSIQFPVYNLSDRYLLLTTHLPFPLQTFPACDRVCASWTI